MDWKKNSETFSTSFFFCDITLINSNINIDDNINKIINQEQQH